MDRLVNHIVDLAICNGVIEKSDRDLYQYSYRVLLEQAITWISIVLISILFHAFMETVLYAVVFIPIRIYCGGYHARTFLGCYFLSVIVWAIAVRLLAQIVVGQAFYWGLLIASIGVILALSPIADPNKPIDDGDRVRYKRIVTVLLSVDVVIAVGTYYLGYTRTSYFVLFAFFHLALLLVMGRIAFRRYKRSED